jgi:two-component system, cell cycle response regulator
MDATIVRAEPRGRPADAATPRPARVLVADDDLDVCEMLATKLTLAGYEVSTATDGERALEIIDRGGVDVAVLDVVMPWRSGFELCLRLRDRPAAAAVPVILLTGRTDREAMAAGLEAGAAAYLTKPVDLRRLLSEISLAV